MMLDDAKAVSRIICDAGGELVGRTRLQKTAYLLFAAGQETRFSFSYKHYGPFSEQLADAAETAAVFGMISEIKRKAEWGGTYSVFNLGGSECPPHTEQGRMSETRKKIVNLAKDSDAVELELAATALFLKREENIDDPWEETRIRKPSKSTDERLEGAKKIYNNFIKITTPEQSASAR